MILQEMIDGFALRLVRGDGSVFVTDLHDDSREVRPGGAFVARRGTESDGRCYIPDAIKRGAGVIITGDLTEDDISCYGEQGEGVAWVYSTGGGIDQVLIGRLADRFFGDPSKKLRLVGVTGTNGKTTVSFLIQHLLEQAGCKCGMIGTVWIDDGGGRRAAEMTTPGAVEIFRLLAAMAANGCRASVLEVSSHALDQGRTEGLAFEVGVFTNLTGDHLDYHGDMDRYARAKARLFEGLGARAWAVVNAGDPYARRMVGDSPAGVVRCGIQDLENQEDAVLLDCCAVVGELGGNDSEAWFEGPWGSFHAKLPLVGKYNVVNALEAVAAAERVVGGAVDFASGLGSFPGVPGRLEVVCVAGLDKGGPAVFVDYAHTHDALENVLIALKEVVMGRLTVVFGCGGDRDRTKRAKMGLVASRLADRVIITSDNPRTEDPQRIIDDILGGVPKEMRGGVSVEVDRSAAIMKAVSGAQGCDTVLLAGKGHEDYQVVGVQKRHFDDREQAEAALRQWGGVTVDHAR